MRPHVANIVMNQRHFTKGQALGYDALVVSPAGGEPQKNHPVRSFALQSSVSEQSERIPRTMRPHVANIVMNQRHFTKGQALGYDALVESPAGEVQK